ncbi:hypothetical protein PRIPAC_76517 [Pristionchus pacificus]|uniref:Uncharacterized protein n=1 Tax=Pristionchus pacificus TaxID=54126 RepID=A0A2A6C0R9_PRIPA|nr:hypothetical protein PRIPAC_76517 [Pristionchus pacificus]|eukprot:PDM71696.1 hypothetical protein PRIPAC_38103 [Pristionchus pacificus]
MFNYYQNISETELRRTALVRAGSTSPAPGGGATTPVRNNSHPEAGPRGSDASDKLNPERKLLILKIVFSVLCILDILHWAYMLRDDFGDDNRNTWSFYETNYGTSDTAYLIARMFGDIFTGVLGLGAAMWTKKVALTIPCLVIQMIFVVIRMFVWPIRLLTSSWPAAVSNENLLFVACEFLLPGTWATLAGLIVYALKALLDFERTHGYVQPPMIVLTVKNDENDESVQIEIA